MVVRTREALEDETGDAQNNSTAITRYRVRPESRRSKRARLRVEQESGACCSCTRFSTCATNNCECVKAQRDCGNCLCKRNCSNQPGWQQQLDGGGELCRGINEDNEDNTSVAPRDTTLTAEPPPQIPLHHRTAMTREPRENPRVEEGEEEAIEKGNEGRFIPIYGRTT